MEIIRTEPVSYLTFQTILPMKRNILLNPGPATTTDSVKEALLVPDICPREQEFGELTQAVLNKVVQVVNGESTHTAVIFTGSGTAGVEAALSSVVPPDGKILIASYHPSPRNVNTKVINLKMMKNLFIKAKKLS